MHTVGVHIYRFNLLELPKTEWNTVTDFYDVHLFILPESCLCMQE